MALTTENLFPTREFPYRFSQGTLKLGEILVSGRDITASSPARLDNGQIRLGAKYSFTGFLPDGTRVISNTQDLMHDVKASDFPRILSDEDDQYLQTDRYIYSRIKPEVGNIVAVYWISPGERPTTLPPNHQTRAVWPVIIENTLRKDVPILYRIEADSSRYKDVFDQLFTSLLPANLPTFVKNRLAQPRRIMLNNA